MPQKLSLLRRKLRLTISKAFDKRLVYICYDGASHIYTIKKFNESMTSAMTLLETKLLTKKGCHHSHNYTLFKH